MPIGARLDPEKEALLDRLSRNQQKTRSDVLREALHCLADIQNATVAENGPHESITDLIGIAEDGPEDLAAIHKQTFRDLLSKIYCQTRHVNNEPGTSRCRIVGTLLFGVFYKWFVCVYPETLVLDS